MRLRDFLKAGHTPTLICAFLYFDISFMVWVLLGALANSIVPTFGLSDSEKGLMVAVPLLGGAILRLVLGLLTDHIGARRTAIGGLVLTLIPLLLGWLWVDSFAKLLVVGLMLGVAGASFAAALPLASRWYPPQYQGLAMGIAGAGNSGTALATFFGPRLAESIGWHGVFALALAPVVLTLLVFIIFAKDSPTQPAPKSLADYGAVLAHGDTWWFCLFYSVTFGGFVGLASFLNIFFHDQYSLSRIEAGSFATLCVISGSFLRPLGGYLADRFGGIRMLLAIYVGVGALMLGLSALPPLAFGTLLMFLAMALLGMGNGSVFQLVPQRFPREIGVITGIVGAAGGIGGFCLPLLLGGLRQAMGSFAGGFLVFALVGISCAAAGQFRRRRWTGSRRDPAGAAARCRRQSVVGLTAIPLPLPEQLMYADTILTLSDQAANKLKAQRRSLTGHFIRSMLAGMYVGAAIFLIFTVGGSLAKDSPGAVRLLMGVCFGGALTMVVFAGSELFTGSNLVLTLGVLSKKSSGRDVVDNWVWTWLGNLAGSLLLAVIVIRAGLLDAEKFAPINGFVLKLIETKMNLPAEQLFWRAVLANWLVCLGVWMAARVQNETARILLIWWCMFTFITSGYEHSVANMFGLALGLFVPHPETISWSGYWYNLVLATLGNIVGGALFVGGMYWLGSPEVKDKLKPAVDAAPSPNGTAREPVLQAR
jgi:NNP family nitrate/nitrite transporter-like MFS transporter